MSTTRRIAIGDIHGCDVALQKILETLQPTSSDLVVTLGDYVDRGPNSREVIATLIQLAGCCRTVHLMGNHELMMRAAMANRSELMLWKHCGGDATIAAYGGDLRHVPEDHRDFLEGCVPYLELEDYFFVHANYTAKLALDQQPDFVLYWEHLHIHMPGPHISGKTAVVGHTPQRDGNILHRGHLICIDTYCYGGKYLTAIDLDSQQIWQADTMGNLRSSPTVNRG